LSSFGPPTDPAKVGGTQEHITGTPSLTTSIAPVRFFFTILAQERLGHLFRSEVDNYFEVNGYSGSICSDHEINHYFDICDERTSALDEDHAKYRVNNPFFGEIAR